MKSITLVSLVVGATILCVGASVAKSPAQQTPPPMPVDDPVPFPTGKLTYETLLPFLNQNCVRCHNNGRGAARFDICTYQGIMRGGEDGPMIKKGDSKDSPLIGYLTGANKPQMPRGSTPLPDAAISGIAKWIDAGAPEK